MGYIYKITNTINQKSYIGQTMQTLETRINKHFSRSQTATTGIDYAIGKYGKENFTVEQLCECDNSQMDELERYYIQLYDTYNNGYNLTLGGQDWSTKLPLNESEIIEKYLAGLTIEQLCKEYGCCNKTISNLLHNNHITIRHNNNAQNIVGKGNRFQPGEGNKPVYIQELDLTFPSLTACSQWLIDNKYSKASSAEMALKSLSRSMKANKTYCKLHIIYI